MASDGGGGAAADTVALHDAGGSALENCGGIPLIAVQVSVGIFRLFLQSQEIGENGSQLAAGQRGVRAECAGVALYHAVAAPALNGGLGPVIRSVRVARDSSAEGGQNRQGQKKRQGIGMY